VVIVNSYLLMQRGVARILKGFDVTLVSLYLSINADSFSLEDLSSASMPGARSTGLLPASGPSRAFRV